MKIKIVIVVTIIFSFMRVSAQDTIWFNQIWKKTTKDQASFYRLQSKNSIGIKVTDYYKNGVIQMTGYSLSGDSLYKEGDFCYYDEKGKLTSQGKYTNDHKTGTWNQYYPDGQLHHTSDFTADGKLDGNVLYYYPDEKLKRSDTYLRGVFLGGTCFTHAGADTIYYPYEEMPQFKGGEQKRIKFLENNIIYPEEAKEKGIQGVVYVSFDIDEKGRINDVKIVKGVHVSLNTAAVEVVKLMPKWKPYRIDGKPVKAHFNMPISFKLN